MKVLVKGPALTRSGYGEHCRFVLRALKELGEQVDIYLSPINWGQTNWMWEDNDERRWFDTIIKKTAEHQQQKGSYDISIQVTIPNEWQRLAPVNIGVTAGIETTKVSPIWLQNTNYMDKIITISNHSKNVFLNTSYEGTYENGQKGVLKCTKDVEVVHYPAKEYDKQDIELGLTTDFNFLTIAQWGPRKNLPNTITWLVEEFIDNPNVGLIVKTSAKGGSIIDRSYAKKQLTKLLSKYKDRQCKVYLLHGDMAEEELHSLYTHEKVHCLVSLTHGEGFGLPIFEAAYSGLPVVATDWSGHLDFLYMPVRDKKDKEKLRSHFGRVDYDLKPIPAEAVWEGVLEKDAQWAYPQQGSYKMKLRQVYKDYKRYVSQAKKLQNWINSTFTSEHQYAAFNKNIKPYLPTEEDVEWQEKLSEIQMV